MIERTRRSELNVPKPNLMIYSSTAMLPQQQPSPEASKQAEDATGREELGVLWMIVSSVYPLNFLGFRCFVFWFLVTGWRDFGWVGMDCNCEIMIGEWFMKLC